ncbi:MAG TPA: phosphoserine phosphatase SerB [Methylophilaceae bacterium]|nr:phosphoserine phosphatase SerB [Methylophilaceae bacterium]
MRLVIQAPSLSQQHLDAIAAFCPDKDSFQQVAEHAYALSVAERLPEVITYSATHKIDCAFVQDEHTLDRLGLVVMDMDSTLITIECIDEIADMHGLKPQVAKITESAMQGEIEFAESLRRRVALLEGLDESALQRVVDERLQLSPGALELIAACKAKGIRTMLVSGGFDFFADRVKALAGLDYAHANKLEIANGKLTGQVLGDIVDAEAKAAWLVRIRDNLGLQPHQTMAIGDGANDLKMMAAAGIGVAYHAKPLVQQQATYALNHSGLDGVVNLLAAI